MSDIFTVTLPDIGEGVVEGEVVEWLKNVGDDVRQDEPVVVVMTDKATVELPAPYPGKLAKQCVPVGQLAFKDRPLYAIALDGFAASSETVKPPDAVPLPKSDAEAATSFSGMEVKAADDKALILGRGEKKAIPKVRRLAHQMGIVLADVKGSGKEERVTEEDLRAHLKCSRSAAPPQERSSIPSLQGDREEAIFGVRGLMAKKMAESKAQIPHFSYLEQVEVERLIQLKKNSESKADTEGVHLTYMPFLIRALSLCIGKHPILNSSCDMVANKLVVHQQQNVGIAMSTRFGLVVPTLKNVQEMGLEQIIRAYHDLVHRAQQGKLDPAEMKEGTITISNFGSAVSTSGAWTTPIINPPEVAILAVSRIHAEPCAKNGSIAIKDVVNLSWSFDHRIIDGLTAVQISHDFCSLVRDPATLL